MDLITSAIYKQVDTLLERRSVTVHILCATDRVRADCPAVARTSMIAARLGAEVTVVDVGNRFSPREAAAGRRVVEAMRETVPDLVVVGPSNRGWLQDMLVGTVAERFVRERVAPVLVVKNDAHSEYQRLLLALEPSSISSQALNVSERLVATRDTYSVVIYVDTPPYEGMLPHNRALEWARLSRARIREFVNEHSNRAARYELMVRSGQPKAVILHTSRRVRPDLLVLGSRGRGRIASALFGSMASAMIRDSRCDVLIAPSPWFVGMSAPSTIGERT